MCVFFFAGDNRPKISFPLNSWHFGRKVHSSFRAPAVSLHPKTSSWTSPRCTAAALPTPAATDVPAADLTNPRATFPSSPPPVRLSLAPCCPGAPGTRSWPPERPPARVPQRSAPGHVSPAPGTAGAAAPGRRPTFTKSSISGSLSSPLAVAESIVLLAPGATVPGRGGATSAAQGPAL